MFRKIKFVLIVVFILFFSPVLTCFVLAAAIESVSCVAFLVGKTSSFSSSSVSKIEKEISFLSSELSSLSRYMWAWALKTSFDWTFWISPSSDSSWLHNRDLLSQAPVVSDENRELILFLKQRWLAKASGFFSLEARWLCPFFGVQVHTHPETTSSYARDPASCCSKAYMARVRIWKQSLPHPHSFPLILTRPSDIHEYLPNCLVVSREATIEAIVDQLASWMKKKGKPISESLTARTENILVDLTHFLPTRAKNRKAWLLDWKAFQIPFYQLCKKNGLDLSKIFCVQRLQQGTVGGIRLLPLGGPFAKETAFQYHVLAEWISCFGLTANKIELDRSFLCAERIWKRRACCLDDNFLEKEKFLSDLALFHQNWKSLHPQKKLMVETTVQLLKGLIEAEVNWEKVFSCPTRSFIAKVSFFEIRKQMELLIKEEASSSFFYVASRVELIHASLSSLLEISLPFIPGDFAAIYESVFASFPSLLKPFTHYGIHTSGMTSLTGILRAVQKQAGSSFHVLYGENSYFEAIRAVSLSSNAISVLDAVKEDWEEADLILTQFNPVLKRDDVNNAEYKVEETIEKLRKFLDAGRKKPLTVAIDCTVDFLDSPRVRRVFELFQREINEGVLNIICFRSGLKFDLLGMDNYCASPFFMVHNHSENWRHFNLLFIDPALQTDLLSLNWFCLAYKYAAPQLELYRKQIFDNTRELLNRIPPKLYEQNTAYRVTPMEEGVDPAFVEMKVFGPLHRLGASVILGEGLYLRCLREGLPIFCRRSFGFYHANFGLLFGEESSSMRLTVGLDPDEIDTLAARFEEIARF